MTVKFKSTEVEKRALKLRQAHNVETYGIKDIISLVERENIELIRYPFGKDVLLGFSTVFEGKKVIVSNSSEILSREIFTIAHEIGHILYDFEDCVSDVKIDKDISETSDDIAEARAYYFANCFLMPIVQLTEFIRLELGKKPEEVRALDIVRIQLEFNVSYNAAVKRLHEEGLISSARKIALFDRKNEVTSRTLFKIIDADEKLLKAANVTKVPNQYLEYVTYNYEKGHIPYSSIQKALKLLEIDAKSFEKEAPKGEAEEEFDEVFEEYQ